MRLKPTFWFSLIALLLMVSGFFVQQSAKIGFVARLVSPYSEASKAVLNTLRMRGESQGRGLGFVGSLDGHPLISASDSGFQELLDLYIDSDATNKAAFDSGDRIVCFVDAGALVPDKKRGFSNFIAAHWADGNNEQTSYEELNEIISRNFDRSIWPLQIGLFIAGFLVSVATISFTHFLDKKPEIVGAKPNRDDDSTTKAYDPDPTGDY